MKKIVAALCLSSALIACGGGGSSSSSGSSNNNSGSVNTVQGLVGLWDISYVENGVRDVVYVNIDSTGSFDLYDFMGDDFDRGDNCYIHVDDFATVARSGGSFRVSSATEDDFIFNAVITDSGALRLTNPNDSNDTEVWPAVELNTSQLTVCPGGAFKQGGNAGVKANKFVKDVF